MLPLSGGQHECQAFPPDPSVVWQCRPYLEDTSLRGKGKVVDIVGELEGYGARVDVYDPWVYKNDVDAEYNINFVDNPAKGAYDVVVVAVAHDCFRELGAEVIKGYGNKQSVIYDIKYVLSPDEVDDRL